MHRIKEIDGLRAIAILLVVAWHYVGASADAGSASLLWKTTIFGRSGVDLFFVLSGYLITSILLKNRDASNYFSTFYARRAFRILPIYYVVVGIYVVGKSFQLSHTLFEGPIPTWTYLIGLQNFWMTFEQTYGAFWLGGTWSLAIEEQFYLAFPMLVYFLSLGNLRNVLLALMIACPLLRIWAYWYGEPFAGYGYYFLTPFRADNLAIGALVAWHEFTGTSHRVALIARRTLIASALLFPAYAALIGRHTDMHMALWGHTYLALLYGSLLFMTLQNAGSSRLAFLRSKPAEFFARMSYALYLVHTSVLLSLSIVSGVSRDVSTWPGRVLAVSAFFVSLGLCWLSFKVFEQRLIRFAHRRFVYHDDCRGLGATRPTNMVEFHSADDTVAVANRVAREAER
jgi:peptidoglycan/LPS O-acetylase OafA/YrhL